MDKVRVLLSAVVLLSWAGICWAESDSIWERETLTNGFGGLNDQLVDSGVKLGFSLTTIYRLNTHGGISTNQHRGRHHGRYEATMDIDLQKLLGIEGSSFSIVGWGGWPDTEGIDGHSVGSAWGTNALPYGNRGMDIVECFFEGPLFGDVLMLAVGKIDFTAVFDAVAYADDECSQFINAAFIDDPTIPFPAQSLGAVLTCNITDSWYVMAGVADAQADARETGVRTALHKEDYFFYALETGIAAGSGTYRVGLWNDPQPKANSDGSKNYRDDVGIYTSCDWLLHKENTDPEDDQGFGAFFRYGYAPSRRNDITNFFSAGFQYQGLLDDRDDDVFGLAYARGVFADTAASSFPEDYESVWEAYYNAHITPWFIFGPSIQYVANPGGSNSAKDGTIFGLRAQMTF
jgi:porin